HMSGGEILEGKAGWQLNFLNSRFLRGDPRRCRQVSGSMRPATNRMSREAQRMKIYSWNVNGIRAVIKKGVLQPFIATHQPDILCLQETKAERGQVEIDLPGYHEYWNSAIKKGYSGTAIFSKT